MKWTCHIKNPNLLPFLISYSPARVVSPIFHIPFCLFLLTRTPSPKQWPPPLALSCIVLNTLFWLPCYIQQQGAQQFQNHHTNDIPNYQLGVLTPSTLLFLTPAQALFLLMLSFWVAISALTKGGSLGLVICIYHSVFPFVYTHLSVSLFPSLSLS